MSIPFNKYRFQLRRVWLVLSTMVLLPGLFSSCKKFLDKPQNSGLSLITTVSDCTEILNHSNLYTKSPKDGQLSCDDYFVTDADFDGLDEVSRQLYSWADSAQRLVSTGAANDWFQAYSTIMNINVALESLDKIAQSDKGAETGDDFKLTKGMALFMRANNHFQVAVEYARPYSAVSAGQDMGIPLRYTSDINAVAVRGTVQQTYDGIVQDIKDAISLLPNSTNAPSQPSKAAAYGLLARVYLAMGNYTLAGDAANSCLQLKNELMDYNAIDQSVENPFQRFNQEVLYYMTMDGPDPSYAKVDSTVIASYTDPNDLRKPIFFRENTDPNAGTYYFKGSYSVEDHYTYFNGLATDEIYLIRAECYARAGNTVSAMTDLNTLLRTRWTTGTYSDMAATSKDDALAKILNERRKEMIMRGQRWSDLKRLNLEPAFAQTLSRNIHGIMYALPPNDKRYELLIPQAVMEYGSIKQNPR